MTKRCISGLLPRTIAAYSTRSDYIHSQSRDCGRGRNVYFSFSTPFYYNSNNIILQYFNCPFYSLSLLNYILALLAVEIYYKAWCIGYKTLYNEVYTFSKLILNDKRKKTLKTTTTRIFKISGKQPRNCAVLSRYFNTSRKYTSYIYIIYVQQNISKYCKFETLISLIHTHTRHEKYLFLFS